jgi:ATP-GRASP peptide maturase of grasp-with-spasm system
MILIITEAKDVSTNKVINWLNFYKVPFVRLNDTTQIIIEEMVILNNSVDFSFTVNTEFYSNKLIKFSDIKGVWYRRGYLKLKTFPIRDKNINILAKKLNSTENVTLVKLIWRLFKTKPHINNFEDNHSNKLENLIIANSVGINIPYTFITQKKNIARKKNLEKSLITKHISPFWHNPSPSKVISAFTEQMPKNFIWDKFDLITSPSLFQELVEKKYEIRAVYFNKQIFAMAIFSQKDPQTSIDFRKYNYRLPNRTVPFIFPKNFEKKIHLFMKRAALNSGSLDIIYTTNNEFVFLEVNPIGQFEQVTIPCNYNLEQKIALKLKEYEEKVS